MRFRKPGTGQQDLISQIEHADRLAAAKPCSLDKLSAAIDFEMFRDELLDILGYHNRKDKGGNAPFDPVFMFRIIVLQKYFALSEEQTEFQILDRFSFMRFLSLRPGDEVPDKNTIWDFKNQLGAEGIVRIFERFDAYLAELGLVGKEGVIVDASFVEVPRQRNSRGENHTIREGAVPEEWKEKPAKLRQKDTDARWAKKNNETHYGYKNHIKCDAGTKLIRRYRTSQASLHDSQCFEELLDEGDQTVWADSAYRSRESLRMLRAKKLKARLCVKGTKAKALTSGQKRGNREKSRTRARVEHIFAHQTHLMKADCIRTIGIMRATMQIGLGNLVYNFIRMTEMKAAAA